jgi:23S rRNA (guanosine2251-2'-O)-methyltransferase
MRNNDRRKNVDRRDKDRRNAGNRRNENRGIVDRRGQMDRRNQMRRIADKEEKIISDLERIFDDQIEGRNAVLELLESDKDINKLYITKGEKKGSINKIVAIANEKKVVIVEKDKKQMDMMAQSENYQGVIAVVPPYEYVEVEDILQVSKDKQEDPFILILDGIEDTHNLGAIIRTAETVGIHGIIIPKRRAASVNSTVSKVACGALEHMKIARVNNINDTIQKLKNNGVWICGTAIDAENYYFNQDLTGPLAIVIGNEGKGISDLVKKNCDYLTKIPMVGKVTSLNASVSTGIITYEALKQRKFSKK